MKNTPTLQRLISAVRPLHSYSQLAPSENYASCDPAIATQVEALCIVTNALLGYRENYRTEPEARSWVPLEFVQVEGLLSYYARSDDRVIMLSDDGLIDLIISRPTDAEIIASTMISRKTADSSLIQLILENDARPLSDGII